MKVINFNYTGMAQRSDSGSDVEEVGELPHLHSVNSQSEQPLPKPKPALKSKTHDVKATGLTLAQIQKEFDKEGLKVNIDTESKEEMELKAKWPQMGVGA